VALILDDIICWELHFLSNSTDFFVGNEKIHKKYNQKKIAPANK